MHPRAVYVAEVWAVKAIILGQSRVLSFRGKIVKGQLHPNIGVTHGLVIK